MIGKRTMKRFKITFILFLVLFQILFSERKIASAETNLFVIDAEHVYPNMETAYQEGYMPTISSGKAMIVLPLIYDNPIGVMPGSIKASVDYGNLSDSPFVIRQYQKQVKYDVYHMEDGKVMTTYLVEFDLDLKENRVNGTYPIQIEIQYRELQLTSDSVEYVNQVQKFPVYVTITDGINPGGESEIPQGDAKLKLENCRINPQTIYPGDAFTVTADLKNSSPTLDISNMKISYENAEGILTPTNSIGSVYLEELKANQTGTISFRMKTGSEVVNYNQKISLTIQYEDKNGNPYTDTENIYITIQPKQEEAMGPASNLFEIETTHRFSGMDSSYQDGYAPKVQNGKAHIIMPLHFQGSADIYGEKIKASIEFINTVDQPFQMKSYVKDVKLNDRKSKEGDSLPLYLVDFSLGLEADRINGVYPVNIKIQYELDHEVKEQVFTVYMVITDGKDPNGTEEPEEKELSPKLIITDCSLDPAVSHTGDTVTFQVTLKNTNKKQSINNIKLTYSSDTGEMIPAEQNNSIYIEKIKAGETKKISFDMRILEEVSAQNQKITLNMEGEDENAMPITASESLYLSVELPFNIAIDKPVLANEVESGSTQTITFPIMNTGKTKIRNVICTLDMEGIISSGSFYIGEIDTAVSAPVTLDAIIANKKITDEAVSDSDKYGYVQGTITVSYEDTKGNAYQEVLDVSTTIIAPANDTVEKEEISSQWWISIMIGMAMLQVIVFIIMFYRKKRNV